MSAAYKTVIVVMVASDSPRIWLFGYFLASLVAGAQIRTTGKPTRAEHCYASATLLGGRGDSPPNLPADDLLPFLAAAVREYQSPAVQRHLLRVVQSRFG